ncbi:hypothetical protein P8452_27363 [Trifolium repens]|nr:hypothetical protein P8452_27363 [Trifolium repens]
MSISKAIKGGVFNCLMCVVNQREVSISKVWGSSVVIILFCLLGLATLSCYSCNYVGWDLIESQAVAQPQQGLGTNDSILTSYEV